MQPNHLFSIGTLFIIQFFMTSCRKQKYNTTKYEEEGEIVYPKIIIPSTKRRRDILQRHSNDDLNTEQLSISFKAHNKPFDLNLYRNKRLLRSGLKAEILHEKGLSQMRSIDRNCYYNGVSNDDPMTKVAISKCNGIRGVIQTKDETFTIHPLNKKHPKSKSDLRNAHLVRRLRRNEFDNQQSIGNMVENKTKDFCGIDDHTPHVRWKRGARSRKFGEQTIEALLVVDEKMTQYYGVDAAKDIALALANIAHGILLDSSIGPNPINLMIVKLQIFTTPQDNLIINHHASNTLASFGKWAGNKKDLDGHYDYAILLTKYDICKDKNEPCDTVGISHVSGMCSFPRSASVIETHGLPAAFTIAHQVGHSLGIDHDGVGNNCDDKNIMAVNEGKAEHALQWSQCSRDYLQQFLATEQSNCLSITQAHKDEVHFEAYDNPGSIYDANMQCQLYAGPNATQCYYGDLEEICVELLCLTPGAHSCITTGKPAIDGTICGRTKWCQHGGCTTIGNEREDAIDGGWADWAPFTPCSRSCGGGIMSRQRSCLAPKPKHGGKYCEGDEREYSVCNKMVCENVTTSFKDLQCQMKLASIAGEKVQLISAKAGRDCSLICQSKDQDTDSGIASVAIDGTECLPSNENIEGRCIAGECKAVGCNLFLGSRMKVDRCNICGGDGSSCQQMQDGLTLEEQQEQLTQRSMTGRINASTSDDSNNQGKSQRENPRLKKVLGQLMVLRKLMKKYINAKCDGDVACLHSFNEFDIRDKKGRIATPETHKWVLLSSGCSVSCGVGMKTIYAECRRIDDGSPAAHEFCNQNIKPVQLSRECRMPVCEPDWKVGEWSDCSQSCMGGLRQREAICVQSISGNEYILDDMYCGKVLKPLTQEQCNDIPCGVEWHALPYGSCTTTCGRGIQRRAVQCRRPLPTGIYKPVNTSMCSSSNKPATWMACNVHNPCPGDGHCGGKMTAPSGVVKSPNYPLNYPTNQECVYEIMAPIGQVIQLSFIEVDIDGVMDILHRKCNSDFLRIIDGACAESSSASAVLVCGRELPQRYTSTGSALCMKFVSSGSRSGKGFAATYKLLQSQAGRRNIHDICDIKSQSIMAYFGILTSPNYPQLYPPNEDCEVTMTSPDSSGFVITFEDFRVGSRMGLFNCENDFLVIKHDKSPEKICGFQNPGRVTIPGKTFTVTFHSGAAAASGVGFVMTFISKKFLKTQMNRIKENITSQGYSYDEISQKIDHQISTEQLNNSKGISSLNTKLSQTIAPLTEVLSNPTQKKQEVGRVLKNTSNVIDKKDDIKTVLSQLAIGHIESTKPPQAFSTSFNANAAKISEKKTQIPSQPFGGRKAYKPIFNQINQYTALKPPPNRAQIQSQRLPPNSASVNPQQIYNPSESGIRSPYQYPMAAQSYQAMRPKTSYYGYQTGASCPHQASITCQTVTAFYQCRHHLDCARLNAPCCLTNCPYVPAICHFNRGQTCPSYPPKYPQPTTSCRTNRDCYGGGICCPSNYGYKFCHK